MERLQEQSDATLKYQATEAAITSFIRRMQVVGRGQDRLTAAVEILSGEDTQILSATSLPSNILQTN